MKATSTLAQIRPTVGVKMRKATAPPPPPSLRTHNGNGSLSAEDSDSLSGESLEGSIDLNIILPDGQVVKTLVEKRTPMMDLLVQVTKSNGLSPGSFVLDVKHERGRDSVLYKPNTPVGCLNTSIVYVVPKSSVRDAPVRKDSKAGAQPFEKTFRLRVHLPRNQLHVLRVSPNTPLIDIFNVICTERELNCARYELRHPVHTEERLDPQRCLADYCLSEVAMVSVKGPTSAFSRSSSDIMALQQDDDRKKNRFFGFMFKKSKSISKSIGDNSSDGHSSRGVSPTRSDGSGCQSISPPPSTIGHRPLNGASSNNKGGKKRLAPPPPKIGVPKSAPQSLISPPLEVDHQTADGLTASSHSRHSSDSSGYHEASILSESPEANVHHLEPHSDCKTVVTTAGKMHVTTNLTTLNSTSTISVSNGPKKRKAPVRPPNSVCSAVAENIPVSTPTSPISKSVCYSETMQTNDSHSSRIETITHKDVLMSNGKNAQRSDSMSSHASSSSNEELKKVAAASTKAVTAPVPLPRQSKTPPIMCRTVVRQEKVMEKITETVVQHSVEAIQTQSDSPSDKSSKRQLNYEEINNEQRTSAKKMLNQDTNNSTIAEARSDIIHLNSENDRRSSDSSTDSVQPYSDTTAGLNKCSIEKHEIRNLQETSLQSNNKSCNWTETKASHETEVISALRKMSIESQSSSDSSGESDIATIQATDDEKLFLENSSHTDDNTNEKYEVPLDASCETERKLSISSDKSEPSLSISANSSRKSSTLSDVDKNPENLSSEAFPAPKKDVDGRKMDETFATLQSDLFSSSEYRDSDILGVDKKTSSSNDDLRLKRFNDEGCRRSSSSSSDSLKVFRMQQEPRVKEADVIALSAQIDQTISEHKIAAEIDEAFASIDLMDSGSDNGDDKSSQSKTISSDPVITWEYKIPEVPRQFQNDYEGNEQVPSKSSQQPSRSNKEKTVTELASKSETKVSKKVNSETKQRRQPPGDLPKAETSASKNPTVEKEIDVQVRRTYRRPVVNFSISSYKDRDEEEAGYGHKLTKADSFSQKSPVEVKTVSYPSEPKVSKGDTSALFNSNSLDKRKVNTQVPGQSSAIAKVITGRNDSADKPTVDKVKICDSKPEGGLRKAKSELQLNSQASVNLSVPNGSSEQERLQQEYLKLHQQFLQWQQQLLQNQTVLQQQQILPESSTETLQHLQQLMSLPMQMMPSSEEQPAQSTNIDTKDYSQRTHSLPRPKSAAVTPSSTSNGNSSSLERRLPRVGPRPWRPIAVSVASWNQRPAESVQGDTDKQEIEKPIQIISSEDAKQTRGSQLLPEITMTKKVPIQVSSKEKISSLNSLNTEKPVIVVNRQSAQTSAFRRCPVVKGFAMEPQQKSKVVINSAKENPILNGRSTVPDPPQPINSKPGVVRVNISPKATSLNMDKPAAVNNSNEIDNTRTTKSTKIDRVYFGGPPSKPSIQTVTYFGDKLETRPSNLGSTNGSESKSFQKVASNVHHSKPTSHNYGGADAMNKSTDKKFTTIVNLAQKQEKSSQPPPPPPPLSLSVGQQVTATKPGLQANIESKKSPTSPTANGDFKDELMLAIRGFGGRTGLKKVSSSETAWENRHGKFN